MQPFRIVTPRSISQALDMLREGGEEASVYAGGTEMLLAMKQGLYSCSTLVDIKFIDEMKGIRLSADGRFVEIGAVVTHSEALHDPILFEEFPIFREVEMGVANVRIRNAGTLVGNLCFAEPHSDIALLSVLLNADLEIVGPGQGWTPASDFLMDSYSTALLDGALVKTLRVPRLRASALIGYARHKGTERPLVAAGVKLETDRQVITDVRVVIGAVEGRPIEITEVNEMMIGVPVSQLEPSLDEVAVRISEIIDATDDYEASGSYRRHLAGEMFVRAAKAAINSGRSESL